MYKTLKVSDLVWDKLSKHGVKYKDGYYMLVESPFHAVWTLSVYREGIPNCVYTVLKSKNQLKLHLAKMYAQLGDV